MVISIITVSFCNQEIALSQAPSFSFTVSITEDIGGTSSGLPGVTIFGSHDFHEAGAFTAPDGTYRFNILEVPNYRATTLFFQKEGYHFSPTSISLRDCIDGICAISAERSETAQHQIVRAFVFDEESEGVSGARVMLAGSPDGCTQETDRNGRALFSIPTRSLPYCNDNDQNTENDFYHLFASPPSQASYRIETPGLSQSALCLTPPPSGSALHDILLRAVSDESTARTPLSPGSYQFHVQDREGDSLLTGFWLSQIARTINSGTPFSMASYGLHESQSLLAIPPSGRYVTSPPDITLSEITCPGGHCQLFARTLGTPSRQATIRVSTSTGEPVSGTEIAVRDPLRCDKTIYRTTNSSGEIHFSFSPRDCMNPSNAISYSIRDSRYSFTSDSGFSFCSASSGFVEEVTALPKATPGERTVSGIVFNSLGAPFPRVLMMVNGVAQAITRDDGTYTITLPANTPVTLLPQYPDIIFNQEVDIPVGATTITSLDFRMVATRDGSPFEKTPPSCHSINGMFTISGIVIDEVGNRVSGVLILNGDRPLTTTGADGTYSIALEQGESLWIRAEYERNQTEVTFTPAAIAEPRLSCNKAEYNFQITQDTSFLLTGRVFNKETELPLADTTVHLVADGVEETTKTNSEGVYLFFTDGDQWSITPDKTAFICDTPQTRSGTVDRNFTNLDFRCIFDLCPNDPDKAAAGECGCGVAETDSDQDGVPDCIDGCIADPGKVASGECGCGIADSDRDGDGVLDCNDDCPSDGGKTTPGVCGCGIVDVDTDGDGIFDCNDRCSEDPLKSNPGMCGCGVTDTDTDGDGSPDCVDQCKTDPNKTAPGQCGCGALDTDTDGDGFADCVDQCKDDRGKSAPGQCGCGTPDTDSDRDGTADCNDECSDNPYKTTPGICGCEERDTDLDRDGTLDCQEECPSDPLKLLPGLCGCGVSDTDTDGDGTPDCNDQCRSDPLKTLIGACGCGVLDTDSDGDGTPDCNDECETDPNKAAPGQCGCGAPDTDTDGDGVADCVDQCVDDSGKTAPGQCGCGTPDTDSDRDKIADCLDECPNDRGKQTPGICGCGTPDRDTDQDGTYDCNEECPFDPHKLTPGICGCGIEDRDTDGDGSLDCQEECPNDPLKTTAGVCGCGTLDTDTDGDGTPDCNDRCETDPNKTVPGQCGCGAAEGDTDGDGVSDCVDQCLTDPSKSEPGACGCGAPETDSDFDGVPDCIDRCPNDRSKTEPGTCGCGTLDTDRDKDGTLDCQEECPADPLKIVPGICGCGIADIDTDGDGTFDCQEQCPRDPRKTVPGACGCGTLDTDSDVDGVPDCNDECRDDTNKVEPGQCGCGVPDTDTDGDGTADCNDLCVSDPLKEEPGVCGCGTADTDSDGDGIADCLDLCSRDPQKSLPGVCGCGIADTDTDRDGLYDCEERCPFDPRKEEPGICGCGVADTDFDSDGTANCLDTCPLDPKKTAPGVCGCGEEDRDSNGNGLMDCVEEPFAIEPLCVGTTQEGDAAQSVMEVVSDICWKITNPNPVSYSNTGTRLAWEGAINPLALPALSEEIICRAISPQSTLQLFQGGALVGESPHTLTMCGAPPSQVPVTVTLYGRNGKPLTPRQLRRLERAELIVKARELNTSERHNWQITEPYQGAFSVSPGDWRFGLKAKRATITSRPSAFRLNIEDKDSVELNWAIKGWSKMFRKKKAGR